MVTHPSTDAAPLLSGHDVMLSLWYSESTLKAFFFNFQDEEKISDTAWLGKERTKILEEYENENYYSLWRSDKQHFPYSFLGLSDEDNLVSQTKRTNLVI